MLALFLICLTALAVAGKVSVLAWSIGSVFLLLLGATIALADPKLHESLAKARQK